MRVDYPYGTIEEDDTLLKRQSVPKENRCSMWTILNAVVWIFAFCALIWLFQIRVPSFTEEVEVGTGTSLNMWSNVGNSLPHVTQHKATPHPWTNHTTSNSETATGTSNVVHYDYHNWPHHTFTDSSGLRVAIEAVMPYLNTDALRSQISVEVILEDGRDDIISGIRVEAMDIVAHQILVTMPVGEALLDCLQCSIDGGQEGCECMILGVVPAIKETAVGGDSAPRNDLQGNYCESTSSQAVAGRDCGTQWPAMRCCVEGTPIPCPPHMQKLFPSLTCSDMDDCALWNEWTCANECLGGTNEVQTPNGAKLIDDLNILDHIQTGQKNGKPVYSQVLYLVRKHYVPHLKIHVSGGGFSVVTGNHIMDSKRGQVTAGTLSQGDSLRTADWTFQKVLTTERVFATAYSIRTSDPNGLILTNGVYATENSAPEDVKLWRKVYNFVVFKLLLRIPGVAYCVHHSPTFALLGDSLFILTPTLLLSAALRYKHLALYDRKRQ